MKLMVTGAHGQLGQCLFHIAQKRSDLTIIGLSCHDLDLAQTDQIKDQTLRLIDHHNPELIINMAAYTKVDQAEDEKELAVLINTKSLYGIGAASRLKNIPLIHISTDYVFDGVNHQDYLESDTTNPLSVYGITKRDGEIALRDQNPDALIFRTSWVISPFGQNFIKTMLRLGQTNKQINVVNDQWGAPTSGIELAKTLIGTAQSIKTQGLQDRGGLYHVCAPDHTNWYELANFVFEELKNRTGQGPILMPIPTSQYRTKAIRPVRSVLNPQKLASVWGLSLKNWRDALKADLDLIHADAP